jgi:hypothetical protein
MKYTQSASFFSKLQMDAQAQIGKVKGDAKEKKPETSGSKVLKL